VITFFTIPKPFQGNIGIIQRNAIQSWINSVPNCEIILYGDEHGVIATATEFGLKYISNIKKNNFGTPLLNHIFEDVQKNSKNDIICYINCDIILFQDFIKAVMNIKFNTFLMIGQRYDLHIDKIINLNNSLENDIFKKYALKNAKMTTPSGMDYFIFSRGLVEFMPQFSVGRKGWDNWFVYYARTKKIPVIDASPSIFIVHQTHNYDHIPFQTGNNYEGIESSQNLILLNNRHIYRWEVEDANWILKNNLLLKKGITLREIFRKLILISPKEFHMIFETILRVRLYFLKKWNG
jgi:hypothetical protein